VTNGSRRKSAAYVSARVTLRQVSTGAMKSTPNPEPRTDEGSISPCLQRWGYARAMEMTFHSASKPRSESDRDEGR
jgi:hypothetical protein